MASLNRDYMEFNSRFEIARNPSMRDLFRIYDFKRRTHLSRQFDRISEAVRYLEAKGYKRSTVVDEK